MSDFEETTIRLMIQEGGKQLVEIDRLQAENYRLRELVRCLVNAEHPFDRATLIANAADMLDELGIEVNDG